MFYPYAVNDCIALDLKVFQPGFERFEVGRKVDFADA